MSKVRWRAVRFFVLFVVVFLIGIGIALALRGGPKQGRDIQINRDVSMHLVAVLTKSNPKYVPPDGVLSIPVRYFLSRPVQWINRLLPPKVRLRPAYTIDATGLGADEMRMVYKVDYPSHWNASRSVATLERDLSAVIKAKKIEYARVKIADGTYGSKRNRISKRSHSRSYRPSPVGGSSSSGFAYYLYVTIKPPPFLPELTVDFGNTNYSEVSRDEEFEVAASDTINNPLRRTVTALTNPVALPATQREGDFEVTLHGVVARRQSGASMTFNMDNSEFGLSYIENKLLLDKGAVVLDHFPQGKASDPGGYASTIIMSLRRNGAVQDEWQILRPQVLYGKEGFSIPIDSSYFKGTSISNCEGDLSVYPGPIKISAQLQHMSNLYPDETDTIDLALPKEGELLKMHAKMETWGKKATVLALGYKTTQTVTMPPIAVSGQPVYRTANNIRPDSFFMLTSGSGVPNNVVLKGPGGASFNVNGPNMQSGYDSAYLMQYTLEQKSGGWGKPAKTFNYADYTSVSLTMQDGRTSPVLYEFVVTPQIATGERVVEEK